MRRLVLLLAAVLAGCSLNLSMPAPEKERFLLPELPTPRAAQAPHPALLRIGRFDVAEPFDGEGLVYRTTDLDYASDFYHQFFVPPGSMIRARSAAYLSEARPFRNVISAERLAAPYELRASVTELYADVRERSHPAAVLAIRFYLLRTGMEDGHVVFDRLYRERVVLADARAASVVQGLAEALARVLGGLEHDLEALAPLP